MMILLRTKSKNSHSCLIEFDDEIRGVLPLRALRKLSLDNDLEIEIDPELAHTLDDEIIIASLKRFLDWIAFQERSIGESRTYLHKFPIADDLAQKMITKAIENNYLNDHRCAQLIIESLINKSKSLPEIKNKLYEKKIAPDQIDQSLAELYDDAKQKQVLENLVIQLIRRWREFPPERRLNRICNYLVNRGFNYYDIMDINSRNANDQEG